MLLLTLLIQTSPPGYRSWGTTAGCSLSDPSALSKVHALLRQCIYLNLNTTFFFSLETTAKFHMQHKNDLHSWHCGPIHYCILSPLPSYPKVSLTNLEQKWSLNSVTNTLWLLYLSWLSLVAMCPKPEVKGRLYCCYWSGWHECWIYTGKILSCFQTESYGFCKCNQGWWRNKVWC